jgi:hypothetical protein
MCRLIPLRRRNHLTSAPRGFNVSVRSKGLQNPAFSEVGSMTLSMSLFTMILFVAPIAIGIGGYFAIWMKEEFYRDSFYEDYND